jgi:hypothetical protein
MSSKDDQISSNRRRLFKALSAAPVVATLRPGEALANTSAYQCAENIVNGNTPLTEMGPNTVTDGFWAMSFPYYPKTNTDGFFVKITGSFNDSGVWLEASDGGAWYDESGPLPVGWTATVGGELLTVTNAEGNTVDTCSRALEDGRFVVLGDLYPSTGTFVARGVYPQMDSGDGDGITGTCMASMHGIPQDTLMNS